MTRTFLLVALGGALGSSARALVGLLVPSPWATLLVNVAGGLLMGWLFALLGSGTALGALLMTGALGGFTTFSAFSLDALRLVEGGRGGQALAYVSASVALSLLACWVGLRLGRLA
ncbi:fluoride efflux transporter FluC [Rubellimicrobium aerolatum]|uniref:Fluoride-specific ion channel FluC n=1 Tax=Rubellimicrobium aerolatum TaxID=490979 RepID=A0ABW0SDJ3_9RHOB|nr:CrcB family protein [Rubellimicrobium aerolatum]MBP1806784.1 CrcB protein [Rubellimicrobium aerolatum]